MNWRGGDRLKTLVTVLEGKQTLQDSSSLLRLTKRQVRRLVQRLRKHGGRVDHPPVARSASDSSVEEARRARPDGLARAYK